MSSPCATSRKVHKNNNNLTLRAYLRADIHVDFQKESAPCKRLGCILVGSYPSSLAWLGKYFFWDAERHLSLRCELDAAFFHLYGIGADDADYILETFPIVKRHDEEEFGEYRTKRVILERYGEYGEAIRRNQGEGFALKPDTAPAIPAGELPPVPALPTIASILDYLARIGVQVENNRAKGGGLWVYLGKAEFGRVAEQLEKSGVGVRYYPEGRTKHPGEQWEIDPGKRLS
jgi:hypothetical protein